MLNRNRDRKFILQHSMNLLTYNHTISSLFVLSGRLYQKNIIPILILTTVLIAPAFLIGFAGMSEVESIVFFISVRVLEAGITLGIIGTAFGRFFPSTWNTACVSFNYTVGYDTCCYPAIPPLYYWCDGADSSFSIQYSYNSNLAWWFTADISVTACIHC